MKTAPPLGVLDSFQAHDHTLHMSPGDSLLLYTDGLTEATNREGVFLDEEGLISFLKHGRGDAQQRRDQLLAHIQTYEDGTEPSDDKALILMYLEDGKV